MAINGGSQLNEEDLKELRATVVGLQEAGKVLSAKNRSVLEGIKDRLSQHYTTSLTEMLAMVEGLLSDGQPVPTQEAAIQEREFSAAQREKAAEQGAALGDGSFPILNKADLANAIQAYGRAGDKPAAKAHIIKRAKALSAVDLLPEDWQSGAMKEADRLTEAGTGFLIEAVAPGGREWDVILIAAGLSKNGTYYPPETLSAAAPLFEGVSAFADHATEADRLARPERSIKDKVGRFSNVQFGQHKVGDRMVEGLKARFKVLAPWLRETLLEAHNAGEPDFLGFSIDAEGRMVPRKHDGRTVKWVEAITRARSVDVVTDPAAGGRLVRLVASNNPLEGTTDMDEERLTQLIQEQVTAAIAAASAALPPPAEVTPPPAVVAVLEVATDPTPVADEMPAWAKALSESLRIREGQARLTEALAARQLSEVTKDEVRREYTEMLARRDFTTEELAARIQRAVDYEARLVESMHPVNRSLPVAAMGAAPADKMRLGLLGWFKGEAIDGVKPTRDLRESYARWTGTDYLDVDPFAFYQTLASKYDSARDADRLKESLATSDWGQVFGDVFRQVMIDAYRAAPEFGLWRQVVSNVDSVPDFRTNHWARVGGYGDLATVAERATYPSLTSPTDEEATYALAKRGGIEDITMEMVLGDRLSEVRTIPARMANAAVRTLYKDVMDFITIDNPTLSYDSVALYHSTHNNTGTTALSVAGLNTTQIAMRDQTIYNTSAEVVGRRNKVKHLVVPNELEERANRIINPSDAYAFALSSTPDADTSLDPATFKGSGLTTLVYDYLTDATDWFAVADPALVPTMVVGFLNGRQEPDLFVQDQPNVGSTFTADKISYKIRIVYGMEVLEHRSFYRQVVA